ncbi:hypothetical protein EIP86_006506 [Pleurotus ostreatoroseus]|nr:hypothetical protein EIP86_006506 [Pleurotus ostreatoroseus]
MAVNHHVLTDPPTLPQELVDTIIDLLAAADDRTALGACALTSRRWTHRARTHLHHTLTLRHRTYHVHPRKCVAPNQRALDPAVRGALEHVRVLHVRGESSNLCFHTDMDACDSREAGELFWEVLGAVMEAAAERTSVETAMGRDRGTGLTVKLTDLYCGDARTEDTERLCAVLRVAGRVGAISHVEMADCEFRCPDELRQVLQACGTLETLKLDWIFWARDTVSRWGIQASHSTHAASVSTTSTASKPADSEPQFGNLTHLQVGHCAHKLDESIVKMIAFSQEHPCVKQLSLGPTDLDIEMLPAWTHLIGASVEHLWLSFAQIGHPDVVKRGMSFLR